MDIPLSMLRFSDKDKREQVERLQEQGKYWYTEEDLNEIEEKRRIKEVEE